MNQGKSLQEIIKKQKRPNGKKYTITSLSEEMKIPRRTLYWLFEQDIVPEEYLFKFRQIGIDLNKPMTSIIKNDDKSHLSVSIMERNLQKTIPLYDMDRLTANLKVFKEGQQDYVLDHLDLPLLRNATAAWQVIGDDMNPVYKEGSYVMVKMLHDKNKVIYGKAYYILTDENLFIRYIRKGIHKDTWLLCSPNKENYDDFEIDLNDVKQLFLIRGNVSVSAY